MKLFIFIFLAGISEAAKECRDGWIFNPETAKCFYISERFYHFDEAMDFCYSMNDSVPMMLTSMAEKSATIELTNITMVQPWIGARRNVSDGKFYLIDGSFLQKVYWAPDEPKDQNGDCVTYRGLGLIGEQVTQCYDSQPAMCKYLPDLCNGGYFGGPYSRKGSIQSPNYPIQYYNNLKCYYYISSPNGTQIVINFTTYQLDTMFDRVRVFDGFTNATSKQLGTASPYNTQFASTTNQMLLIFTSNYAKTDIGWSLDWVAQLYQPTIVQNGTNGTMTSSNYPNNYQSYENQLYTIQTNIGSQINITFDDFYTQAKYDYLEIYDVQRSEFVLIANISGLLSTPFSYTSTLHYMKLKFTSNINTEFRGWHANWFAF